MGGIIMRRKSIILIICLIIILSTTACQKTNNRDTPMMAAMSIKVDMSLQTYKQFTDTYMQGEESWISKEQFHEVKNLMTAQAGQETYQLLKFTNGEMILVEFASIPEAGEFKIQGIKIVPDNMKEFFK